jgi:hypothetical protein
MNYRVATFYHIPQALIIPGNRFLTNDGTYYEVLQNDGLSGFKSIFKKVASIGAGFIPGVGGIASSLIESVGNSNPDMDKKCAKKPNDKKCVPYLAQKRQAEANAANEAKAVQDEKDRQAEIQNQTLAALKALQEQQTKPKAETGGIGGFDTQTLLIFGAVGLAAVFILKG